MANQIILKNSGNVGVAPSSLAYGELAINYFDGNLYYQNASNVITVIASNKTITLSGNVVSGNINTGNVSLLGNVLSDINTTSNITTTATTSTGALNASGIVNFSTSPNVTLGSNANVHISGGTSGQHLATDGAGNLYWASGTQLANGTSQIDLYQNGNITMTVGGVSNVAVFTTTGVVLPGNVAAGNILTDNIYYANGQPWDMQQPAGSNTQIQFNNNGNFGADANLAFDSATGIFSTANITASGTASVTGTVTGGNLATTGTVSATGTGTFGNVATAGTISATGTATVGNVSTVGEVSAAGNVYAGNIITNGPSGNISGANVISTTTLSAAANVIAGNVTTVGQVSATGNITGDYYYGNGAFLTGVVASSMDANNLTGTTLASSVVNSSLTSVGTLTSLNSGTISSSGNITGANINTAGNVTGSSILGSYISSSGNVDAFSTLNGLSLNLSGNVISPLNVTGNVTAGNVTSVNQINAGGNISTTGDLNAGNLSLSGNILSPINMTGTLTAGNLVSLGYISGVGTATVGNLDTAGNVSATGNVTGGNILAGSGIISTAGTITGGNLNAGSGVISTTGNIIGNTVQTNYVIGTETNIWGSGNISLSTTGNVILTANTWINNLNNPVQAQDAATKYYVDNAVTGLTWKTAAQLLASGNIALTGTSNTLVIDGHTALSSADTGYRLLLTGQTTASDDGIYVYTDNGSTYSMARSSDADTYQELEGASIFILEGTQYGNTGWVQTNHYLTSFSGQQWVQFAGGGTYSGGTGINVTGTVISLANTTVTPGVYGNSSAIPQITVNQQGQLTLVSDILPIEAPAGNLTGTTLNSTVVNSSLTSVGTLGSLSVSGTVTAGNIDATTGFISTSGNITGGNVNATGLSLSGNVVSTLNVTGAINASTVYATSTLSAAGNIDGGNLNTTGNAVAGNFLTNGQVSAQGNITGGNIITSGAITAASFSTAGNIYGNNLSISNIAGVDTLNVTTYANIMSATVSANTTTGALVVLGGVGIGGDLNVGGAIYSGGNIVLTDTSTINGGTF